MKKNLKYYLNLPYPVTIEPYKTDEDETQYTAEIPDLPGCSAWGKTRKEALERLQEAKDIWLRARLKRNLPISEPIRVREERLLINDDRTTDAVIILYDRYIVDDPKKKRYLKYVRFRANISQFIYNLCEKICDYINKW